MSGAAAPPAAPPSPTPSGPEGEQAERRAARSPVAAGLEAEWRLLAGATIAFGLGFGINSGAAQNFAASFLGLPREQLALLESLREVPGLLTAAMMGVVASLALPRLAAISLALVAAGFALIGQTRSYWPLVACNILWSIGLHIWLTVQPALTLTLAREGRHGHGLGLMSRYQAFAIIGGLLLVWALTPVVGFGVTFLGAGAAVAAGCFFARRLTHGEGAAARQRLVFRFRYWRYYLLMLLDGGRRQVVMTFALLILIKEFGVEVRSVAFLLVVNGLLTMAAAPAVGRWTDRLGERTVLSAYYALVAVVFWGYTQISGAARALEWRPEWLFCLLFAVDNLLFTASVGIQTYIRHTAPPEELAPSLAMGLTWNHVAAVAVPLVAGHLWVRYGYATIFQAGIGLALASLAMCLLLPRRAVAAR